MRKKSIIIFIIILALCRANQLDAYKAYIGNETNPTISILDTNTNTITGIVEDPNNFLSQLNPGISFIAISPDGKTAYAASNEFGNGPIAIIDVETDTAIGIIIDSVFDNIHSLTISPDGTTLYVMSFNDDKVVIIDLVQNIKTGTITVGAFPAYMAITPDGTRGYVTIAQTSPNGKITVITLANETIDTNIADSSFNTPEFTAMSSDGKILYVSNSQGTTVSVINTTANALADSISGFSSTPPGSLALSPDNKTLYVNIYGSGAVAAVNTATKAITEIPVSANNQTVFIGLTPDGKTLYAMNYSNGKIAIINTANNSSGQFVNDPNNRINKPVTIAFVPNPKIPSSATGTQIQNIFLTQTELANMLSWQAPTAPSTTPVSYMIYRDASLTDIAGTVPASGPLTFQDHDRLPGVTYTYYIVAVDQYGAVSLPAVITVNPS